MAVGVIECHFIYKLKYCIFFVDKNTGKKAKSIGKHREFCLEGSVATL